MMTDILSGRGSSPACFVAGHSKHHWMVQRWSLSAVLRLLLVADTLTTTRTIYQSWLSYILIYLASFSSGFRIAFLFPQVDHVTPSSYPSRSFRIFIPSVFIKFPPDPVAGLGRWLNIFLFIASSVLSTDPLGYSLVHYYLAAGWLSVTRPSRGQ